MNPIEVIKSEEGRYAKLAEALAENILETEEERATHKRELRKTVYKLSAIRELLSAIALQEADSDVSDEEDDDEADEGLAVSKPSREGKYVLRFVEDDRQMSLPETDHEEASSCATERPCQAEEAPPVAKAKRTRKRSHKADAGDLKEAVLDHVRHRPLGVAMGALVSQCGGDKYHVRQAVNALLASGDIRKEGNRGTTEYFPVSATSEAAE